MYYILYDCPKNQCDKIWLYNWLDSLSPGNVAIIDVPEVLSDLRIHGGFVGRIKSYFYLLKQAVKAVHLSTASDRIVCWSEQCGLLFNQISRYLLGNKRRFLAMNWLTPPPSCSKFALFLYRSLITNPQATIQVNGQKSPEQWLNLIGGGRGNFVFIPDAINEDLGFSKPLNFSSKKIFAGGMNNRDWGLYVEIARNIPDFEFICISLKRDWDTFVIQEIPNNLTVLHDVTGDYYYEKMRESKLVLLPLKEDRVSGLINITMSIQSGIPCVVSDTDTTRMYYKLESKDVVSNAPGEWIGRIMEIMNMSEKQYDDLVIEEQAYICSHFSPENIARSIFDILQ